MCSNTRRLALCAALASLLISAPAQPPARPAATPAPAPPLAPASAFPEGGSYLERDTSAASARRRETRTVEELFQGQPTLRINLKRAIEMALRNNLDVKYDKVSIAIQRAEIKFALGVFDPLFSFSTQYQSTQRPQDLNNPSTTSQILQQQGLQEQLNNAAIQNFAIQQSSFNSYIASQQNLTAVNGQAAVAGVPATSLPNQMSAPQAPTLTPIVNPVLNDIVVLNQTGATSNLSLSGRLPTGTRYAFQATAAESRNTFTGDLNPVRTIYEDTVGLQLQQPLLRGFGTDVNMADVRTARINGKIQTLTWKNAISNALQGVIAAYYDMTYAMDAMRVQEEAIGADSRLVELYRRRVELGFGSPFDISQAEVQVSSDREALLIAKNVFLERQFALKRLILSKFDLNDSRLFFPERTPNLRVPALDRPALLGLAFQNRYDYRGTVMNADIYNIRLKFARNQLLPQLDLVGTYGLNGLGTSFSGGFSDTFSASHPQWSVGFQFQVPIGNRQARAQYDAVLAQREQAILRIKQAELGVGVDVDTAISRIETNRQRMDAARKTRELGEEAIRIAYRRLEEGQISAYDITEQQRRLYDAKARELAALAELNKAVSVLWLATGTVLDREGIGFQEPTDFYSPPPAPATTPASEVRKKPVRH